MADMANRCMWYFLQDWLYFFFFTDCHLLMIDEIPIPGLKWIDEDGPLSYGEMVLFSSWSVSLACCQWWMTTLTNLWSCKINATVYVACCSDAHIRFFIRDDMVPSWLVLTECRSSPIVLWVVLLNSHTMLISYLQCCTKQYFRTL